MDALVGLLAAAIGALSALIGSYLAGRQQAQLEYRKWLRTRADDVAKELGTAVAETMRKLAIGGQAITWLTWQADFRPHTINEQVISEYDAKMASLHPEIQSSLILVSAMSNELYKDLAPLMSQMYVLDAQVSFEASKISANPDEAVRGIARYRQAAHDQQISLPDRVVDIMNKARWPETSTQEVRK